MMSILAKTSSRSFVHCSHSFSQTSFIPKKHFAHLENPRNLKTRINTAAADATEPDTSSTQPEQNKKEDLWQFSDREQWYLAKFAADDQPDWNPAVFLRSRQLAPGIKEVVLHVEVSRERVPLRNSYRYIGQKSRIRVNGSAEQLVPPASPPTNLSDLQESLWKARGDIFAGEVKQYVEPSSSLMELSLLVHQDQAPELYNATQADLFEVGPFTGNGINILNIMAVYRYPTVIIFCEGEGIATARALAMATDKGGLEASLREDVRMYYRAQNQASVCFADELDSWKELYGVNVIVSTRDSFQDMFDDDDTLLYDPETTAAIVLTGGENEEDAVEACVEADIQQVAKQSEERPSTKHMKDGRNELSYS